MTTTIPAQPIAACPSWCTQSAGHAYWTDDLDDTRRRTHSDIRWTWEKGTWEKDGRTLCVEADA